MDDDALLEQTQFEALIQGLIDHQFGCCDDFVSAETSTGLRANMHLLQENGEMQAAGVGQQMDFQRDVRIRGDRIHWISEPNTNEFETIYLQKIWKFIQYLNATCFTSIQGFESHYANYAQGDFYKRHLDQFKHAVGRKFSIVLYLNADWKAADGGMLSLYPEAGATLEIAPIAGRMVFFRSDEMEHAVQPSLTRDRRSIAGWLKN